MTKVRILSGNFAGQIVEQTPGEAEMSISTGFAEAVPDDTEEAKTDEVPPPAPAPKPVVVEAAETIPAAPPRLRVPPVVPTTTAPTKAAPTPAATAAKSKPKGKAKS